MIPFSPIWASGGSVATPDNTKIAEGWTLGEKPPHEYMNWFMQMVEQRLNHVLQTGMNNWEATISYGAGALVRHGGFIYRALIASTNSTPAPGNANWRRVTEDASNLTTGTVPAARLSGSYSFTGLTLSGPLTGNTGAFSGAVTAASFSGGGAALTGLNANQLTTGTVPNARMAGNYSWAGLNLTGSLSVDGNIASGGIVRGAILRSDGAAVLGNGTNVILSHDTGTGATGSRVYIRPGGSGDNTGQVVFSTTNASFGGGLSVSGTISGNGSGLTDLNATRLTAGTVPNDRLNGSYAFASLTLTNGLSTGLGATIGGGLSVGGSATVAGNFSVGGNIGTDATEGGIVYVSTPGGFFRAPTSAGYAAFTFQGDTGTGLGRIGSGIPVIYADGTEAMRINKSSLRISAMGDFGWYGRGNELTNLDATQLDRGTVDTARLPANAAANNWTGSRLAGLAWNGIGMIVFASDKENRETLPGVARAGSQLVPGNAETNGMTDPTLPGTWRCLGHTIPSGDRDTRTTCWQRIA